MGLVVETEDVAASDRVMSVVARVSIPAERFALGEVLRVGEDVQVRLESMIPLGDVTIPYVWVGSDQADAVVAALDRSSVVEKVRIVDEADGETLLRVEWSSEVNGIVGAIGDSEGVILEGTGNREEGWTFRLRFPDHAGLSEFYRTCIQKGISLDLKEVHGLHSNHSTETGLTAEQHDTLRLALERGYFAVPRRITLVELANELGISDTATSQRLRRGLNSVLSETLGTEVAEGK